MRLDQFLRASRLVLRRSVAQELCEAGAVEINGRPARASRAVREGDEIVIKRRDRLLTARVLAVPDSRRPARGDAASFYELLRDERPGNED